MKRILSNPAQTRRLTKWAIELSEFEITFVPKTGVKAQTLVDFIIECIARDPQEEQDYIPELLERPQWTLYIDGASNHKGSRTGILIQGPEGLQFEYALRFSFKTTNNEAEYEAMVTGLLLAQSLSITRMVVHGDSKLVIEQIRGDCGVKSESLQKEKPIHEEIRACPTRPGREDWRSSIIKFLTTGELPKDKTEARKLQMPSAIWGIDLVGHFVKPSAKYKDAVVVVDYFSKWMEAIPLRNTTAEDIEDFIWKNIITQYGIPKILVSDNGPQFDASLIRDMCKLLGIEH
ncbi:hypothetical protein LIER_12437 [Lithospermum erythrorhizon]|uniref:Integrase catalytic domain-containing protein n=1 Tax=Lithospermum erythrorhizon TaxID=34254 RepID=A0AAV3PRW8_LITER